MKGTAFLFIILTSGLFIVGSGTGAASNSDVAATLLKTQIGQERTGPDSQLLIADRMDTENEIIYGTDQKFERTMTEQEKAQKENELRSWQMLQNMNIYKADKKQQGSNQGTNQGSSQGPNQ